MYNFSHQNFIIYFDTLPAFTYIGAKSIAVAIITLTIFTIANHAKNHHKYFLWCFFIWFQSFWAWAFTFLWKIHLDPTSTAHGKIFWLCFDSTIIKILITKKSKKHFLVNDITDYNHRSQSQLLSTKIVLIIRTFESYLLWQIGYLWVHNIPSHLKEYAH